MKGIGVSAGIGIGKILLVEEHSVEYTPKQVEDAGAEKARFKDAVGQFCENTRVQAEALRKSAGDKEAEIMLGHISIVQDPFLLGEVDKLIDGGQCAESAFDTMCEMFISIFSAAEDDMTRQRAAAAWFQCSCSCWKIKFAMTAKTTSEMHSWITFSCTRLKGPPLSMKPIRLAGTWQQYSKKAIIHEKAMTR